MRNLHSLIAIVICTTLFMPLYCSAQSIFFSSGTPISQQARIDDRSKAKAYSVNLNKLALGGTSLSFSTPHGKAIHLNKTPIQSDTRISHWRSNSNAWDDMTIWEHEGKINGIIHTANHSYSIQSDATDSTILIAHAIGDLPPEHSSTHPSGVTGSIDISRLSANTAYSKNPSPLANTGTPTVRIFFAFTPAASSYWGKELNGAANTLLASFNTELSNSQIQLIATVAGTIGLTQDYATDEAALVALKSDKHIIRLRNQSAADIVVIVGQFTNSCGMADTIFATPDTAFAAVDNNCAVAKRSLSHEIGHLFGARHDRLNDPLESPFPNAHGYASMMTDGSMCYHTIMAYEISAAQPNVRCFNGDPRIAYFSNPLVSTERTPYGYWPTGHVTANAASVVHSNGAYMARLRNTPLPSGALTTFGNQIKAAARIIGFYISNDQQ